MTKFAKDVKKKIGVEMQQELKRRAEDCGNTGTEDFTSTASFGSEVTTDQVLAALRRSEE